MDLCDPNDLFLLFTFICASIIGSPVCLLDVIPGRRATGKTSPVREKPPSAAPNLYLSGWPKENIYYPYVFAFFEPKKFATHAPLILNKTINQHLHVR